MLLIISNDWRDILRLLCAKAVGSIFDGFESSASTHETGI